MGESGSGKSTLAKLLVHYYDLNEGKIRIGGQDITDMSLEALIMRSLMFRRNNFYLIQVFMKIFLSESPMQKEKRCSKQQRERSVMNF